VTVDYGFAAVLCGLLFVANLIAQSSFVAPDQIAATLAIAAPFVLAAIASTPSVMSGGGGIDLSIGPLLGFVNVVFVAWLVPHGMGGPFIAVPILLAIGIAVGLVNGILVAVVRLQPIVATLGTYLILNGAALTVLSEPGGTVPGWTLDLGGSIGPVPGALILVGAAVVIWLGVRRSPFHTALRAVGGEAAAAYSAGVDVRGVRIAAYALGGCLAAIGGIALSALIGSGDPNQGPQYTLIAIAAVSLGGTSLAGGRGGIAGAILGALAIFLVQNLLAALLVSPLWLQVVYGGVLVVAVVADGVRRTLTQRGAERFA
jgi:ribose transport system permease protein